MKEMKRNSERFDLVMLVDDGDIDNFIHERVIQRTGFAKEIEIKNSGIEALKYLNNNQDKPERLPNIIFLDIHMPLFNGFDFLKAFDDLAPSIKDKCQIMVVSSATNPDEINKITSNSWVRSFLPKPLSEKILADIHPIILTK